MNATRVFETVIVGGGCAGTLLASILQRLGMQTLVIERQGYPRFAIGESSTPLANQMLRKWACRYDLPHLATLSRWGSWQRRFPEVTGGLKRGFSYLRHHRDRGLDTGERHPDELLVAANLSDEVGDTHWLRADVDRWLADQARRAGAEVWERCELEQIERRTGEWLLETVVENSTRRRVRCPGLLVDASGPTGVVAKRCGAVESASDFVTHTRSTFTHADDLPRFEYILRAEGARLADYPYRFDDAAVHHLVDDGWLWQIRFQNGRTSIGLVDNLTAGARMAPEHDVRCRVADYRLLKKWLTKFQLANPPGSWIRTDRLQRRLSTAAGDGWVALPHTFAFVDPLHSTGIAWTLWGIDRIVRSMETRRPAERWIEEYSAALARESRHLDALIGVSYLAMPDFELFCTAAMVYFAAATLQEQAGMDTELTGFLGADDAEFTAVVHRLVHDLAAIQRPDARASDALRQHIREQLKPFDRIGLFSPTIPHMYAHTAAPP